MANSKLARAYLIVAAGLLAITGCAKLYSVASEAAILGSRDVLLPITVRQLLALGALLELCIGAYCIYGTRPRIKHLLVLWLGAILLIYRLARWWVSPGAPCLCLGAVGESLPIESLHVDTLMKSVIAYLIMGSLFFLGWETVTRMISKLSDRARRRLRIAMTAAAVVAILPAVQIGCVAMVRPPFTIPIVLHRIAGHFGRVPGSRVQFRWTNGDAVARSFYLAVLAAEDIRFFRHWGFDWEEIRYVMLYEQRPRLRGASTITQQCARSLFLWQGRSWIRKALEAYYTVWMELLLSKRRILELYVNVIELGDGIYGIEAAAKHYYGKSARDLSRDEAAMLAAILPAPKRRDPLQPDQPTRERHRIILRRMDQVRLPWESASETAQTRASTNTVNMAEPQPAQTHENGPPTDVPTATAP